MNFAQAETLVFVLRAAYPRPPWDDATKDLYVTRLTKLDDYEAAKRAIDILIDEARFRPTVAEILTEYRPLARRNSEARSETHGLPLPEISEAERRANVKRIRQLRERIEKAMEA